MGDNLWLHGFVVWFLGELAFSHSWMTVTIEVAEITLAVVTQQIDLAPIVMVETYHGLDCVLHRCRHFYGCRALVQVIMPLLLLLYNVMPFAMLTGSLQV